MKLVPRYDGDAPMRIDEMPDGIATLVIGQRERLATTLASLDDDQWAVPSRCEGWTVHDVMIHLSSTNRFWTFSVTQGLAGTPTTFLQTFDPVTSPADLVAAAQGTAPRATLDELVEGTRALADALDAVDDWQTLAEAPPGHIAIGLVAIHALWDSWVHERDIMLPLGLDPVVDPAEVEACLLYAIALGPAFLASAGSTRQGAIALHAHNPDVQAFVEAGPVVSIGRGAPPAGAVALAGDAVELLERLSVRVPFTPPGTAADRWLFEGLVEVFDTEL